MHTLLISIFFLLTFLPNSLQSTCLLGWNYDTTPIQLCSCNSGCDSCDASQPSNCLTCSTGFYLQGSTCKPILNCAGGSYFDETTGSCILCDATCQTCSGPSSTDCTSCALGSPSAGGSCTCIGCLPCSSNMVRLPILGCFPLLQCLQHTYYDTTTHLCKTCDSSCLGCSGPSANQCTSCLSGTPSAGVCGCAPGTCTSCPAGYYLSSATCRLIPTCPSLTVFNATVQTCLCTPGTCTSCPTGYYLQTSTSSCLPIPTCLPGTYFDTTTGICELCYLGCSSCTGTGITQCTGCLTGSLQSGACLCIPGTCTSCPSGYYLNTFTSTCLPVLTCLPGTYFDTTTGICNLCYLGCSSCTGTGMTQCTGCLTGSLQNGACLCLPGTCTSCPTGYYLQILTSTCLPVLTCLTGSYFDTTTGLCLLCYPGCATCTGTSISQCTSCLTGSLASCTSCPTGTYLNSLTGLCLPVLTCTPGTYFDTTTGACLPCYLGCTSCTGSGMTQCTSCLTGSLQNGACLCAPGTCTSCPTGYYLLSSTCFIMPTCLSGNYFDTTNYVCQACSLECLTCATGLGCLTACASDSYISVGSIGRSCIPKLKLQNVLDYGTTLTKYAIRFNTGISLYYQDIMQSASLSILTSTGAPIQQEYNYTISLTNDFTISIEFSFTGAISSTDVLQVSFDTKLLDTTSLYLLSTGLATLQMMEYFPYAQTVLNAVSATATTERVGYVANQVFSTVSAAVLGSAHSMRSQATQATAQGFLYMNIDFPPNYMQYAKSRLGNSEDTASSSTSNSTQVSGTRRMLDESQGQQQDSEDTLNVDKYIQDQRFQVNLAIALIYMAVSLAIIPVFDIAVYIFKKKKVDPEKWYYKLAHSCSMSCRWSFFLNKYISTYQELAFFSCLEMFNYMHPSRLKQTNLAIAILGVTATLAGLILVFVLAIHVYKRIEKCGKEKSKDQLMTTDDYLQRMKVMHFSFENRKLMQLFYPLILMVRSLGFVITTIFFFKETAAQIIVQLVCTVFLIVYLIIFRAIADRRQLIITLFYETFFLISISGCLALYIYSKQALDDIDSRTAIGFMVIAANNAMTAMNFISFGVEIFDVAKEVLEKAKAKIVEKRKGSQDLSKEHAKDRQDNHSQKNSIQMAPIATKRDDELPLQQDLESNNCSPQKESDEDNESLCSAISQEPSPFDMNGRELSGVDKLFSTLRTSGVTTLVVNDIGEGELRSRSRSTLLDRVQSSPQKM